MAGALSARNLATAGAALIASGALIFLLAFRAGARRRSGPDWRFVLLSIAIFFLGGILLIFGIVSGEVWKPATGG